VNTHTSPPGPHYSIRASDHEILVGCFAWNFLESTATVATTTSAMTAREPVGNSGVVEEVEDVLVDAWARVREDVPELPALLESPP